MIGQRVITLKGESFEVREETPRLWVAHEMSRFGVQWRWRFPKKGGDMREARNERGWTRPVFITEEARQRAIAENAERQWASKHSWRIGQEIQWWKGDVAVLRQVAALIGYVDDEAGPRTS